MTSLDFDDPNFLYWWAATSGDVVFWKVPVKFYEEHKEQIKDALPYFGEEWGTLSSHGIRTLDLETLNEIDPNGEMMEEP